MTEKIYLETLKSVLSCYIFHYSSEYTLYMNIRIYVFCKEIAVFSTQLRLPIY